MNLLDQMEAEVYVQAYYNRVLMGRAAFRILYTLKLNTVKRG